MNNQSYWLSGSTRTTGNIDYLHYRPYEIGAGKNGTGLMLDMFYNLLLFPEGIIKY